MTGESAPAPAVTNNSGMHITGHTKTENIRFLLLTITACITVISTMMIVVGILVYLDNHRLLALYEDKTARLMSPSAMSVFIGLALLIVSIFGFFGTQKLSTCMVNVYACILAIMFIFELVVVILAFTMDINKIMFYINVPVWGYNDARVQQEVDALQTTFKCCGSNTFMDYLDFNFTNNQTVWQVNVPIGSDVLAIMVPKSCCFADVMDDCVTISSMGCKEALVNALVQNSTVLGVLGISAMFINLLGIIVALLLARCIRKLKSARALITWKLKENMIMQREAEEMQKNVGQVYIKQQASSQA